MLPNRFLLLIMIFVVSLCAENVSAEPYDGQGPGESTIGTGGDYPSLFAACEAVSATPLAGGDWTFLILNDLQEENEICLAQAETNGNTITFRPAPGTNPEVNFQSLANSTAWQVGHFTIGARVTIDPPNPSSLSYIPTDNIVIDGCNTPGNSDRNLTFTNAASNSKKALIAIMGDCSQIHVKNCVLESLGSDSPLSFPTAGVQFYPKGRTFSPPADDQVADDCSVVNCKISGTPLPAESGGLAKVAAIDVNIISFTANFPLTFSQQITITGNELDHTSLGILAGSVSDFTATSNTIALSGDPTDDHSRLPGFTFGQVTAEI